MVAIRTLIARALITAGMMILPANVRKMMRGIMLYHVPGALTEDERAEVLDAKSQWSKT